VSSGLPIDAALPALRDALATEGAAVLQAAPGAGKSTVVPLALLEEAWARGKRLLMLEPRRLATRAIATRMARGLNERVGETIGYRMRLDTRVSRSTRVEVITEGVLTRLLQEDPALEGVAAVIFDEFHERNLQADLGLALALDARATLAPDMRILVMSATLEASAVARLIGDAPLVSLPMREFTLELRYAGRGAPVLPAAQHSAPGLRGQLSAEQVIAQLVVRAMREEPGDVLVFMPGAAEIRRVQALLEASRREVEAAGDVVRILPLYGELAGELQDAALAPAEPGTRKIVLATNIAETGLTVPGVRIVVDSGLMRRARFDPVTGMSRLETQRISRASAEQRAGRAARTAPGVCYRAWSEGAHGSLAAFTPPEISDADLAPLALELASWGIREAGALRWLDAPPAAMLASARDLLSRLGALGDDGRISAHGREMARLGVHPRLAHMLLRARGLGNLPLAARLAALLSERDLLRADRRGGDADIRTRLELLGGEHGGAAVERATLERARRAARDIVQLLQPAGRTDPLPGAAAQSGTSDGDAGLLLSFAYPDRIGLRRPGGEGRYTLANGRGASFAQAQSLARRELIVAVDLDDRERDARILLAAPLQREALLAHFADHLRRRVSVHWSTREQAVIARRTLELDALVLEEKPLGETAGEASRRAMLEGVRELGIEALPWQQDARNLQSRIEFMRAFAGRVAGDTPARGGAGGGAPSAPWPDVSDINLGATLDAWLSPWLDGVTRREHLARVPLIEALRAQLTPAQQRELEQYAPTHLTLPGGSRVRVDYVGEHAPAVSVRLQELFGVAETPRLGRTGVAVTLRLLSPAQRPVQVTRDIASFWRGAYAQVRKDLRGRYPKHYWPENPLEAQPTRGVRRPR
jgi:ATP-dependent helicase HrpB